MRYVTLSAERAVSVLEADRAGAAIDETGAVPKGNGPAIREEYVESLLQRLTELKSSFSDVLATRDPQGGQFESEAVRIVHPAMRAITREDPAVLSDDGFWRWLAVCRLRDIIRWRHPDAPDGRISYANYGVGRGLRENLLYRIWIRGELAIDSSVTDEYHLAVLGDQDFWRSHIIRQRYGWNPSIVRALVRYQYPNDDSKRLNDPMLRELAKRLRRVHENLIFGFLNDDQADKLLDDQGGSLFASANA